ncbi:hypothetical protein [Brucella intermedia]|uniref:hypothetical protein n=1 Tax=Brucella intermedia TaxID=94625 RepID=UPI00235DF46D|nr:hypothetical protein [Brucella intermedia]
MKQFYVKAETVRGTVRAYGVYDCIGGMESEHAWFEVNDDQSAEIALRLANQARDDLNAGIA